MPVTVDSSSSESDSEASVKSESKSESDSSESSDWDGLQNWMILGRGKQDGDQFISVNLEEVSDSNAGVSLSMCGLIYVCALFVLGELCIVQTFAMCLCAFERV